MTAAGKGRVRFYLNQRWGDVETRVARLGDAIGLVAGSDSRVQWRSAARHLGDQLKPYGVALDVDATSVRRIKVYSAARSATVDAIASYVQTAVPNADLQPAELLVELCERAGGWNRPWMVMPCLEFDRESDVVRAKIDVALCALRSSDVALDGVMRDMLRAGSLPSDDYDGVMAAMSSRALNHVRPERLQYASVGCVPGRPELTVYFSPDLIDVDDRSLLASSACTTDALV